MASAPSPLSAPVPYRIETDRLVIRCYEPADAEPLRISTAANKEHLATFMPWAHLEPQTIEDKATLIRRFRGNFDLGNEFVYGIFDPDSGRIVGGSGLHPRGEPGTLEIGYWIDKDHVGRGFATEAAAALVRAAFELFAIGRVDLRCDPRNAASARVAEKLGFVREGLLRQRLPWHDGTRRDALYWSLLSHEYPHTIAARAPYDAFDFLGRRVP
jgi:RimJ/RimL family protein N-acetyltransferase